MSFASPIKIIGERTGPCSNQHPFYAHGVDIFVPIQAKDDVASHLAKRWSLCFGDTRMRRRVGKLITSRTDAN